MRKRGAVRLGARVGRLVAAATAVIALAAAVPGAQPKAATIYYVGSTADGSGAGATACTTNNTANGCTLREAISLANANSGGDTISFAGVAGTITLESALPDIADSVTITGPGAAMLTVRRGTANAASFRIFQVSNGITVAISGLTITGGSDDYGGGIRSNYSQNDLTLDGVIVTGNAATDGGGGISTSGKLTVRNSTISDNTAAGSLGGGGILRLGNGTGTLTVENSTISGNTASVGGGLALTTSERQAVLRISGSTFADNTATGIGGGGLRVEVNNNGWQGRITNSTFSGNNSPNTGASGGGGILVKNDGLTVTHSTITGNTTAGSDSVNGSGGGIRVFPGKSVTLNGSIIAGNTGGDVNDVSGDVSGGFNLIGDGTGVSGISDGVGGNIVGTAAAPVNPRLSPLGNYGGTRQTRALLPGSPALDAAGATCPADPLTGMALTVDQRGIPRPQPTTGGACDIGAFESRGFTLTATAGMAQQTTAGRPFPTALAATLAAVDTGVPMNGATVTFAITAMNGATGTFADGMMTPTATANASGVATAPALTAGGMAGSFIVTANTPGAASVTYTLTVNALPAITTTTLPATTQGAAYNQTVTATGGTGSLAFTASGLPTGLMIGMNNGTITGTPMVSGTAPVTVTVTDAAGAPATQMLTLTVNPSVTISTTTLPAATINRPYSQTVMATGGTGTLAYAAMRLPNGLTIDSTTGAITGTPTATGTSTVSVTVTDGVGASATRMLALSVSATPAITTTTLPVAVLGAAYNQTVATTGGTPTLTFAATMLPAGLMLNAMTGAITGTPTATGASTIAVTVTDANGATATQMLALNVNNPAPVLTNLSQNGVGPGSPAFTLTVTGAGFVSGSVVRFNGTNLATTFVSPTQLMAQVPASAVTAAGTYTVTVVNAAPGGGTANALTFTVVMPNAAPTAHAAAQPMGVPNRTPLMRQTPTPIPGGMTPNANPPRR